MSSDLIDQLNSGHPTLKYAGPNAYEMIAGMQRQGFICAFVDMQDAYSVALAVVRGVDVDELLVTRPESAQQALEIIHLLQRSGEVGLIVYTGDLPPIQKDAPLIKKNLNA